VHERLPHGYARTVVRAVLFDFFGTLTMAVRRGPAHANIARWLGCDPVRFAAELDRSFRVRARGGYGPPADALRRVTSRAGGRPSGRRLAVALSARSAAIRADTRLRPDAVPVLTALHEAGLPTALVSDCGPELPLILSTLPVAPLLTACVYSVEVGVCKPHPRMYLTACARLGVAPEDCLYVGDGGGRELSGARALGMTAVRLGAPDLGGHLQFDSDTAWTGLVAPTLTQAVDPFVTVPKQRG
jgi:putative hydrolase of the HAD superfamily